MATIQIKNVPKETHQVLRRRAAEAPQSLQEYMLRHVIEEADQPTLGEIFDRIERRGAGGSAPFDEVVSAIRADRDSH